MDSQQVLNECFTHKMTILSNLNAQKSVNVFLMLVIQDLLPTKTMMVLFKYVTHTGVEDGVLLGTTSAEMAGQTHQLK